MACRPVRWNGLLENLNMKAVILLLGLVTLFAVAGCEEEHEHHRGGAYGGAYQGYPEYPGYGQGEYQGYPNYGGYPYGR